MASDQAVIDAIVEQLSAAGDVRSRKMFGEYAMYCDEKVVALVCDNQLFVKITEGGAVLAPDAERAAPYPGAKPCFVIPENRWGEADFLAQLIRVTANALPKPKPKPKRK